MISLQKLTPQTQSTIIRSAALHPEGRIAVPATLQGGARVFGQEGVNSTPTLAGVQTANPANLGLHPDGSAMPRCRLPYWNLARKDPFRLGETQRVSGSCIHAGMSRWPCSTRQTSMCSGRST